MTKPAKVNTKNDTPAKRAFFTVANEPRYRGVNLSPGLASYSTMPSQMYSSPSVKSRTKTAIKRTLSSPKRTSYMDPTLSKMNLYAAKGTIEPVLTFVKKNRPKSAMKGVPEEDEE